MRPFDLPVELRESAWDALKWAVVCALFTALSVTMLVVDDTDRGWTWTAVVFFGVGTLVLIAKAFRRGELRIDEGGLVASGLHRPLRVEWGWVERFVVASVGWQGSTQKFVGMVLTDEGVDGKGLGTLGLEVTNGLAGIDALFPSTSAYGYGDWDELVGRLNATLEQRRDVGQGR